MKTKNVSDLQKIDPGLMMILSSVEAKTGANFYLTSILRSTAENEAVGGWVKSQHLDHDNDGDAQAVDIRRSSFSGSPEEIARLFYSEGATGVGIYDTHIHVDNNPSRVSNPYFKDYRTKKTKFDEQIGITFSYFKNVYNKTLAELRKGKNDSVSRETISDDLGGRSKFDDNTLIKVGSMVVGILILLGVIND